MPHMAPMSAFYVLTTSSVTVTDLMLGINQSCYRTAMGVKTLIEYNVYCPSVHFFYFHHVQMEKVQF